MKYRIERQGVIKVEDIFLYQTNEDFSYLDIRTEQKYFEYSLGSYHHTNEQGLSFYIYDEKIEDDVTIIEIPWTQNEETPLVSVVSQRYGLECILMNLKVLENPPYIHLEKEETNELQKD